MLGGNKEPMNHEGMVREWERRRGVNIRIFRQHIRMQCDELQNDSDFFVNC